MNIGDNFKRNEFTEDDLILEFNSLVYQYNVQCEFNDNEEGTTFINKIITEINYLSYIAKRYFNKEFKFDRKYKK